MVVALNRCRMIVPSVLSILVMVSAALSVCILNEPTEKTFTTAVTPTDLSIEDDGADMAEVTVKVDSVYRWELESNPTTGYNWYLVSDKGLKIDSEFITRSDLCGAPGVHVFKITSDKAGSFTLKAEYKRQWEKVDPIRTEEITITFS